VNITDANLGNWYFGFYGLSDTAEFLFELDEYVLCQNECSGPDHGSCVGSTCRCKEHFFTSDCGTMRSSITIGEVYPGLATYHSWNYYSLSVNSARNVIIKVTNNDTKSHCEVYVKFKTWPTLTNFTIHNTSAYTGQDSYTVIPMPMYTDWKIGIYGAERCSYKMVIIVEADMDCHCSSHGHCVMGTCVCDTGYSGQSCDITDLVLKSNITILGSIGPDEWQYYVFEALNCTQMAFIAKEEATIGQIGMYISVGQPPNLMAFLVKDDNTEKKYHRIALLFQTPPQQKFPINIAIYGKPTLINGQQASYKVVGFQTPF